MTSWIKLEVTTPDKPEIVAMAARLRIDQDAVVGKCFRIWAWADLNSVNGHALPITADFIDKRLTSQKGFAAAMRAVGWLEGEDGALTFPGFDRHNGATAKARAESARRMAKSRDGRNASATDDPSSSCADVAENPQQKPQPDQNKSKNTDLTHSPRAKPPRLLTERPEGWPRSEEAARSMAVAAGAPPDMAATYWHHHESLQEWPPGSFASFIKAKAGFKAADLAAELERDKARAVLRLNGSHPTSKPSTPARQGW